MKIELKKTIPDFIKTTVSKKWEKDLVFDTPRKHLVTGSSGSGKTTFLSILYGISENYSGEIFFDDKNIRTFTDNTWADIRKQKIAIVFQGLKLFSNLSVLDNILIKHSLSPYSTKERILNNCSELGIKNLLTRTPLKLSQGERQRAAIIRALTQPFSWLFLDEPFSHLDDKNTQIASALIQKECEERNAGVIITNHKRDKYFTYANEVSFE